jgi:beta-glucosidase
MSVFSAVGHSLKRGFSAFVRRGMQVYTGVGLAQKSLTEGDPSPVFKSSELRRLTRQAAAEGCVLLKNDGALPLERSDPIAVLGRCQYDWFFVGYGSGGDVRSPYKTNLLDGLRAAGANLFEPLAAKYEALCNSKKYAAEKGYWGHWPQSRPEFTDELAVEIAAAFRECNTALVVIGRAAGESADLAPGKGGWLLTDAERAMLDIACRYFKKTVVVLNVGSLIDLSWIADYGDKISAVLLAWFGGQESGGAVCDVLFGAVCPSGRLPDTAARLEDYPTYANFGNKETTRYNEGVFMGCRHFDKFAPEKAIFPFGHGLSYTRFSLSGAALSRGGDELSVALTVRNEGSCAGRDAVLLFVRPPEGRIDKPLRVLCAFKKSRTLNPNEEQRLTLDFGIKALASFDEERSAFILEPGEYLFEAEGVTLCSLTVPEEITVEKVLPIVGVPIRERILAALPEELPGVKGKPRFSEVLSGKITAEDFVSSLSVSELEALTRGHGMMDSPLGAKGNAGVLGGVTDELARLGVPGLTCCDGPAGLRMGAVCTLIPSGTALASTFNTALCENLHLLLGREMAFHSVDVRLAPGLDLHRHPLCGRNFEYFSEDPTLSGLMAAAAVRGIERAGKAACPKHFACNDQEYCRNINDSVVSERALRELHLRAFELCVKEGRPTFIMTSYNKINGVWAHYNFSLVTTVLRGEWGYDGAVMTDWWMKRAASPEFPALRDNAYRVRAGVDILMPGNMGHASRRYIRDKSLLETLGRPDGITRAELQAAALHTVRAIVRIASAKEE